MVAYGFRIKFAALVEIASHSLALPVQKPKGESKVFLFSRGEVAPGGNFWLS